MSTLIRALQNDVLVYIWAWIYCVQSCVLPIAIMIKGNTLHQEETDCRGCRLSLAATAAQASMTTAFADLK
jgi:hypothetical protein